jgi:hypothetical protein
VTPGEADLAPLEVRATGDGWKVSKTEYVLGYQLFGLPLGGDRFAIRGGYAAFANWGDIVRYTGPTDALEIVEPSGHVTVGLLVPPQATPAEIEAVVGDLRWLGSRPEHAAGRFWLVDVPPDVDRAAVQTRLERHRRQYGVDWREAEGTDLLPWLWAETLASRPLSTRVYDRLKILWAGVVLPVAATVLVSAAAAATANGRLPVWAKLIAWAVLAFFWSVLIRRLVRWVRANGWRGALRSFRTRS